MKYKLLLVVTIMCVVACSVASIATEPISLAEKRDLTISVATPSATDRSRVAVFESEESGVWSVEWQAGDEIALCSSSGVDKFLINLTEGSATEASFSGSTSATIARLIYPYDDAILQGGSCCVDLSQQWCDMESPMSAMGAVIPLVSSDVVDLTQDYISSTMRHIAACLKLNFKFSELLDDASYIVESVTLHAMDSQATFDIEASLDDESFLSAAQGDITVNVVNSPEIVEGQIYTFYASVFPFELTADELFEVTVTFAKCGEDGSESRFERRFSVANSSGATVEFQRALYHTINVAGVVDEFYTLSFDGSELQSGSYPTSDVTIAKGDVDFVSCYVAKILNALPIQFKSAGAGYLYNSTPLEWLSEVVITVSESSDYRCEFTVYYGTEQNPITNVAIPSQQDNILTYTIPNGAQYMRICNNSAYAAYAQNITINYGTAYYGVTSDDDLSAGDSDSSVDLEMLADYSPYTTEYSGRWGEIPTYIAADNYIYVTHSATLGDGQVRNYSLCYDTNNRAAAWVAFPYHEVYSGDSSRTEDWGFDPLIAELLQADIGSSYVAYEGVSYDRGHQISSADRLASDELNSQTFYYSNMTPQNASLNRGQWSSLEDKVRAQVCSDTLYVVTGADFTTTLGSTVDDSGNECPIPAAYYKVMLRTRAGNSGKAISECSADELQAIGYWVENIYTGVLPDPVSVSEIEAKCGFEFFPSVPQAVKDVCYTPLWSGL